MGEEIRKIKINNYVIGTYEIDYIKKIKGLYGFIYVTTNLVNGKMYVGQRKMYHVARYSLDGNLIDTFETGKDASDVLKCHASTIAKACSGKIATTKGFQLKYFNNEDDLQQKIEPYKRE